MNIKAEIIPQDTVVNQVKELLVQKDGLDIQEDVLSRKLEQIKASLAENEDLRNKNKELQSRYSSNFRKKNSERRNSTRTYASPCLRFQPR